MTCLQSLIMFDITKIFYFMEQQLEYIEGSIQSDYLRQQIIIGRK